MAERAAWFQNFEEGFSAVGASLGFTVGEIGALQDDNNCFQGIASGSVTLRAYSSAVRSYRKTVTEGNPGEPTPAFPASPVIVPAELAPTGIFYRLDNLVGRIRLAPNYTPEIGSLLGIIPSSPARPPVEDMKPEITVSDATAPYSFTMKATRFGLSAYKVQIQRAGSETWVDNGFAQNSTYTVAVTPATPGQPERLLVRAILMQDSEPVGIPSDPAYVTVNP